VAQREALRLGIDAPEFAASAGLEISVVSGLDASSAAALAGAFRYVGGSGEPWEARPDYGALLAATSNQIAAALEVLSTGGRARLAGTISAARDRWRAPRGRTRCGQSSFDWGRRTYMMGIVNVTPDSFSGDGLGSDVEAAFRQAQSMVEAGADIVDVGGESTRPGHQPVTIEEELARVVPVVERLAAALPVPVSIDTSKAEVARAALAAGAAMVNDIWGLKSDPAMGPVVAAAGVPVVLMHNQEGTVYVNLMGDLIASLQESIDIALRAGIAWENIIIDPGFGFGKTRDHNLEFMARMNELRILGRPVLLGPSRKSTIGYVLDLPVDQRLEGTAALVALGVAGGADIMRVHDVREMARVCRMADAVVRGPWNGSS
jgi:dihydropteroate synthase